MIDFEYINNKHKKFVKIKEAIEIYSIGRTKLMEMAKDAKAVYKKDNLTLINVAKFEEYLETFLVD